MNTLTVNLLLTGDELMAGDIVDSNSAMVAHVLSEAGLNINKKVTVGDSLAMLVEEIQSLTKSGDILIINGGLGPTIDDLTAQALATAAGLEISQHAEALTHLTKWAIKRGTELNEPNLKQTMLPKGCGIIPNKNGSAVGFSLTLNNCDVFCTPGVPKELKVMLKEEIMPVLKRGLPPTYFHNIEKLQLFGLGESSIQRLIDDNIKAWPKQLELGFRAALPTLELKVTCFQESDRLLQQQWIGKLKSLFKDHIVGSGNAHLVQTLVEQAAACKKKITTAESCTGGLIASLLTQISGSSEVFEAGFVTYSNLQKQKMLDVQESTLTAHGAVSQPTVTEMLKGALEKSGADLGVAVSGIAGPSGGSEEKPVGTVWLAWGSLDDIKTECLYYPFERKHFQQYVAYTCIDLLRRELLGLTTVPDYLETRRLSRHQ